MGVWRYIEMTSTPNFYFSSIWMIFKICKIWQTCLMNGIRMTSVNCSICCIRLSRICHKSLRSTSDVFFVQHRIRPVSCTASFYRLVRQRSSDMRWTYEKSKDRRSTHQNIHWTAKACHCQYVQLVSIPHVNTSMHTLHVPDDIQHTLSYFYGGFCMDLEYSHPCIYHCIIRFPILMYFYVFLWIWWIRNIRRYELMLQGRSNNSTAVQLIVIRGNAESIDFVIIECWGGKIGWPAVWD